MIEEKRKWEEKTRKFFLIKSSPEQDNPEYIDINSIQKLREDRFKEWEVKYPKHLVEMAKVFADEWILSMARAFAPEEEIQKAIIKARYPLSLDAAEKWLVRMAGAIRKG